MLIEVISNDGSHESIESQTLSQMIREGRIRSFKRANGWVHVGKDPIRKFDYVGQERRMERRTKATCDIKALHGYS